MDKTEDQKIYEIGYLLVPYLPTEKVAEEVEDLIKAKIGALGGEVTSVLEPVMTRLAYTITKIINNKHTKFGEAYFGALRFKLSDGEAVKILSSDWQKEDNLIRFLLVSLPKGSEQIVAPKRGFARRDDRPFEIERVMPEKEEEKEAMSAEELDKEIDKLVEPVAS